MNALTPRHHHQQGSNMNRDDEQLWTIRDVANFASVRDTKTVNAMIERGDLPPANIGAGVSRRWIASHVRNFVAESGGTKRNKAESFQNRRVS